MNAVLYFWNLYVGPVFSKLASYISPWFISSYSALPTFDEYQAMYPRLVQRGRVECLTCGGTRIFMRGLYSAIGAEKIHGCTTCGKVLYRSKS